ncbi:MAG: response regulator transcription factor [bacterium]|nr:response regulator transcription factor [bacterium]
MSAEPTVWVVDDDAALRNALRFLVESIGLPVRTCGTSEELLDAYDPALPGCMVVDVRMPGMNGLELQQELARRGPHVPLIFLTAHGEVALAVRAVKSGAFDFVEKPFSNQALLDRIREAVATDQRTRALAARQATARAHLAQLSPREREVLDRVALGRSNKAIASELGVATRTVEFHRARIMQKMEADSLAGLLTALGLARDGTGS